MVDLASIDQVSALSPSKIDAVPFVVVERETRDGRGLALGAGFLDPIVAAADGVELSRTLETTPSSPTLQAWANISFPSISKLALN